VFTELVGEINVKIIYDYLEKKSYPISEICQKPEVFSMELRVLMGTGRDQMLGSAGILEKAVLKVLCSRIGIEYSPERTDFPDYVRELKEAYKQRRQSSPSKTETEVKNP
jgi:hypothetical protein